MPPLKPSIKLIGNRVLIKPVEQKKTSGGIIIPDSHSDEQPVATGYIVRVGPGEPTPFAADNSAEDWTSGKADTSEFIKLQVKEGDFVLYFRNSAVNVEIEGDKYVVIPQSSILIYDNDYFN